MKVLIALGFLTVLASCGAQSEPIRPTGNFGVSVGSNGVSTSANVGATSGPVSVSIGL